MYLTVLSMSILLVGTGFTLIAVQRSDRQLQGNIVRVHEAGWCARAGIQQALLYMEQVSDWRSRVTGGKLIDGLTVGAGTVTVEVFDDADGNVNNDATQPVRVVSTANVNGAITRVSAQLTARPHPALRYALFSPTTSSIQFVNTPEIRGPVRGHGNITATASVELEDDAAFETMTGYSIYSVLTPRFYASTAISAPQPDMDAFEAVATRILGTVGTTCKLQGYNLTSTSNPEGTANANGFYFLDAGSRAVVISDFHLRGTLLIRNVGSNSVTFEEGCWIEPGPLRYPVLLIDAPDRAVTFDLGLNLYEAGTKLILPIYGVNYTVKVGIDFNENGSAVDSVRSQVRGIVWSNGASLTLRNDVGWPFIGTAISRGIAVYHKVIVDNDLTQMHYPVPGFVAGGMRLVPGSMREVP